MWGKRTLTQVVRSGIVGAAVVGAFAGGVVVGVSGQGVAPRSPVAATPRPAGPTDPVTEARSAIEAQASTRESATALNAAAIKAMLTTLGDPWASYHPAGADDSVSATLDGSYAGLGLWLRSQSDGAVLISSVLPHSSAVKGGVAAGDQLLSVAGHPARGVPLTSVVTALRGPAGSAVSITTRTTAGALKSATLVRSDVADDDSTVQRVTGGIVLARVAAFSKGVAASLRSGLTAMRRAGPVQGIVLDLRGNPGGLLNEAVGVASEFSSGGRIVSYQQTGQAEQVLSAPPGGDSTTPLVVLVDGGTASAAEVVAGALQDQHRALLVGSKTFGKGSVQQPVYLSDGSTIEFTVGTYKTPSGRSLNNVGLTPDIAVAPTAAAGSGSDPALTEAKTVVGALLADAGASSGNGRG